MAGFGNWLEDKILSDYIVNGTPYVGMHTADPQDGAVATEPVGSAYGRINATGKFAAVVVGTGTTSNDEELLSPEATGLWGQITHLSIWSAATGGNLLYSCPAFETKEVGLGDVYRIKVGQLTVTNE